MNVSLPSGSRDVVVFGADQDLNGSLLRCVEADIGFSRHWEFSSAGFAGCNVLARADTAAGAAVLRVLSMCEGLGAHGLLCTWGAPGPVPVDVQTWCRIVSAYVPVALVSYPPGLRGRHLAGELVAELSRLTGPELRQRTLGSDFPQAVDRIA